MTKLAQVNLLAIHIGHDIEAGTLTIAASFPYISDPGDKKLLKLRDLMVDFFSRMTDPTLSKEAIALWGERTEEPGEEAEQQLRVPAPKKIILDS